MNTKKTFIHNLLCSKRKQLKAEIEHIAELRNQQKQCVLNLLKPLDISLLLGKKTIKGDFSIEEYITFSKRLNQALDEV